MLCPEIMTVWDKSFICNDCNAGPFHENCARLHICDYSNISSWIPEATIDTIDTDTGELIRAAQCNTVLRASQ